MKKLAYFIFILPLAFSCSVDQSNESSLPVDTSIVFYDDLRLDALTLPEGFRIDVFARVKDARSLAVSPDGTVFVGSRGGGHVHAFKDENGDYKADKKYVIATGRNNPNGIAFRDGDLYVSEVSKLWKYPNILAFDTTQKELIVDDYPTEVHHGKRYLGFGPDGKLYMPVGAPCNICEKEDQIYASITRMNPDGSEREIVAHGVRNTVGFDWHPQTGVFYFTDNGRDMMGDTTPECELNRLTEAGQHFGYPYCHQGNISDPEFGSKFPCEDFVSPIELLGPHVAPLGMRFYTGTQFPETYRGEIFVALHGSWNRSPEAGHTGAQVILVREEGGESQGKEVFIDGFLMKSNNQYWGRPVDMIFLEDGSMLLSDDMSGTIYRIWYEG
ncbi:MAG: sorbosone dehydrogenase family protein [Cyclobacteriaceae bacterium]